MPRKEIYKRVGDRAAKGDYTLIEPLDYMILDKLPDEGTTMGGIYPLGASVANLVKLFKKETGQDVPSGVFSGQLRSMHMQKLAVKVKVTGIGSAAFAWQRTKEGKKLLNKWKERNSGESRNSDSA